MLNPVYARKVEFLLRLSFEAGEPMWDGFEFAYFRDYPSVQWKLLNLAKLKKQNPAKLQAQVDKLREALTM